MTAVHVIDAKGKKLHEATLEQEVFGIEPNKAILHAAVLRQLANARSGSANSKTRAEVRGGGRKPWRQKGTGRARAGSIRSPLWEGGGVIFGPKPRDFAIAMPRKVRILAVRSALAARKDDLVVVQNFDFVQDGKTKEFASVLKQFDLADKKVLLVLDDNGQKDTKKQKIELAARNIARLTVIHVSNLNVKDLLEANAVLLAEETLAQINKRFKDLHKAEKAEVATTDSDKPAKENTAKEKSKAAATPAPESKAPSAKAESKSSNIAKKAEKPADKKKAVKSEKPES